VLGANVGGSKHGVFTDRPGALSNHFLANLLKTSTGMKWEAKDNGTFAASDRKGGDTKWTGARVDLIFGSNSQPRALAEAYAAADADRALVDAFVAV
jgi:catalase-peroxidase